METETVSKNGTSVFQAKNGSTILIVLFILYAIIFAVIWIISGKNLVYTLGKVVDVSVVLIAISTYFRVARKKLPDGSKVKKYNEQTRKNAFAIIALTISINALLWVLFIVFGFGVY
jgi:hypothetical protein